MDDCSRDKHYYGAENDGGNNLVIGQHEADAIRQKLFEQKQRVYDAEEKAANQEWKIKQLSDELIARERVREYPETRLELAATKRELEDARRLVESKDAEIENLLPQAVVNRISGAHSLRSKDAEIERLRGELDRTRAELAAVRPELLDARQRLERKDEELERLLPKALAARMNPSQGADPSSDQLRRELQQARQELESKDAEIRRLRAELGTSRALDMQTLQSKDAEIDRLRQARNNDLALVEHYRTQPSVPTPRNTFNQFDQARMDMELYLERRERNIEAREAMLPFEHGGRGVSGVRSGSLWDSLQR